ncbi:MAG: tRNA pseudouridine(55) synthase TruB [Deltaproteobacteria bacterium]|nr:tRNA pseudouridine(55) synthase TruB [Deltaproteobacteria bacterium]MBW2698904.1 tRNA pseudouridine(55) synthase TruB [Deltaproteobacteria bacterium]
MAKRRRRERPDPPGPAGFLVVDKPPGRTSHDVVDAARAWLGIRKVGHLGTLDPQATGVLPLAIRSATKLVPFFAQSQKSYVGTVRLGAVTDTLDGEGAVLERYEGTLPDEAAVRGALEGFRGEIEQIPPMYSAVKRDGVPLHKLARKGEEVERMPKQVRVERLELLRFEPPDLEIAVDCSAGTYVRTLAHDLGAELGCGGYLADLRRIRSGPFDISQAHSIEACDEAAEAGRIESLLIAPAEALGFPIVELAEAGARRVENGGDISPGTYDRAKPGMRISAVGPDGRLLAVLELRADRRLWPLRVLPA